MSPARTSSTPSDLIRVGVAGPVEVLDPRHTADYVSTLVLDQIFEPPYVAGAGSPSATPRLFEPLRSEDDGRGFVYSAAVRPGITFSDGTPLTAAIGAQSLQGSPVLAEKVRVELRGERIYFSLESPNPRFDLTLAQSGCGIVHGSGTRISGTGPYRFEEAPNVRALQRTTRIRLTTNANHHGKPPVTPGVEFVVLPPESDGSPRALVEALVAGDIDITPALSAADLVTWSITGAAPVVKPANSTAVLFMNVERTALASVEARRAIAATIDTLEIATRCYERNPAAFVATGVLPPAMSRAGRIPSTTADASRLVEQAGLRGAQLQLLLPWSPRPYLPRPQAAAEVIARGLANAGVRVSIVETRSSDDYFRALTDGRFDLALGGWIAETVDPADFFDALLGSWAVGHNSFANCSRWKDQRTDDLLRRFRSEPADTNRQAIEAVIHDAAPFVPLVYGQASAVHTRRVRNVNVTPTGSMTLAEVRVV